MLTQNIMQTKMIHTGLAAVFRCVSSNQFWVIRKTDKIVGETRLHSQVIYENIRAKSVTKNK